MGGGTRMGREAHRHTARRPIATTGAQLAEAVAYKSAHDGPQQRRLLSCSLGLCYLLRPQLLKFGAAQLRRLVTGHLELFARELALAATLHNAILRRQESPRQRSIVANLALRQLGLLILG